MDKEFGYSFNIQTKKEIDNIKNDINGLNNQIEDIKQNKADKTVTDNTQQQVDNFASQVRANSEEIVQARGVHVSLKDRFESNELKSTQSENKNTEQDNRLNFVNHTNKRQDVAMQGLLNENSDKRLVITGEGNHLKLEHSKEGMVEVKKVIGDTMVNLWNKNNLYTSGLNGLTVLDDRIRITTDGSPYYNFWLRDFSMFKPSTQYTIIVNIYKTTAQPGDIIVVTSNSVGNYDAFNAYTELPADKAGITKLLKVTTEDYSDANLAMRSYFNNKSKTVGSEVELSFIVLEGDYTNKPIPSEYFEGMKSTFEDCLVTQEMIDAGLEKAENLGKYKAELKVVGKNKFNGVMKQGNIHPDTGNESSSTTIVRSQFIKVKPPIMFSRKEVLGYIGFRYYDKNKNYIGALAFNGLTYNITNPNIEYIRFTSVDGVVSNNYQLEEGTVATSYESYKESKQTLYLDEPLYKDNELCIHNGQLGYWKKRDKYTFTGKESIDTYMTDTHIKYGVFNSNTNVIKGKMGGQLICDRYPVVGQVYNDTVAEGIGSHVSYVVRFNILKTNFNNPSDSTEFKQWLQVNPTTVIYELAEPIFVPILENMPQWILDSFNECTLSIDSNIPAKNINVIYSGNVVSVVALEKIQYQQDSINLDNAYRLTVLEVSNGGVV